MRRSLYLAATMAAVHLPNGAREQVTAYCAAGQLGRFDPGVCAVCMCVCAYAFYGLEIFSNFLDGVFDEFIFIICPHDLQNEMKNDFLPFT
jgi:hypothetical protein